MMKLKISSNAEQTYNYFRVLGRQGPARVGAVSERGAKQLQASIKARVPVDTGAYQSSIRVEKSSANRFTYTFEVGSDLPYGHMLEFGGVGVDNEGNTFNRPPRPHFRPALSEFETPYVNAIREVLV